MLRKISRLIGAKTIMTNVKGGQTAPGFSLNGLDGKSYSLDSLRQKGPVVAAFFKISCPVCQFTFPFLERLYQRYGGDNVTFLGISQDDAKATAGFWRGKRGPLSAGCGWEGEGGACVQSVVGPRGS